MHDNPPRGGVKHIWYVFNDPGDENKVLGGAVGKFTAAQWRSVLEKVQYELTLQENKEKEEQ